MSKCSKKCNEIKQKIDSISGLDDDYVYEWLKLMKNITEAIVEIIDDYEEISAENMFIKLGYSKIWCENGFFYYKEKNNKVIAFNLKKKEWSVYDYDTEETRGYGDEELKAILFQEYELEWINWKDYKSELNNI